MEDIIRTLAFVALCSIWFFVGLGCDKMQPIPSLPAGVVIEIYPTRGGTNEYQVHYDLAHPAFGSYEDMMEELPHIIRVHNHYRRVHTYLNYLRQQPDTTNQTY